MTRPQNQNENSIIFRKTNGHSHNGTNSSLIDTSKYSVFDFATFTSNENSEPSRNIRQENNKILLKKFIVSSVEEVVLRPQGILIPDGTVTAAKIVAGSITSNELTSDLVLVNNIIKSNNYIAGTTGWIIASNGSAEFSNVTVRGTIVSNTGTIGGWTVDSNSIYSGTKGTNGSYTGVGNITISTSFISSNQFTIASNGVTTFKGILSAPSGNIAGWTINAANITSSTGNTIFYSNGYIQASSGKFTGQIESASGNVGGWKIASTTIQANVIGTINVYDTYNSNISFNAANGQIFSHFDRTVFLGTPYYVDVKINNEGESGIVIVGNASGSVRQCRFASSYAIIGEDPTTGGGTTITGDYVSRGNTFISGNYVNINTTTIDANVSVANTKTIRATTSFITTGSSTTARLTNGDYAGYDVLGRPSSLRELKENIEDIDNALEIISDLRPRKYNFKVDAFHPYDPNTNQPWTEEAKEMAHLDIKYGFIVDEILDKRPELISYSHENTNADPYSTGGYFDFNSWKPTMWEDVDVLVLAVKAIQELNQKIENLESRLKEIEGV